MGRNDNRIGILRAKLELKHCLTFITCLNFCAMMNRWMKKALKLSLRNKYTAFYVFRALSFLSDPAGKYLFKAKSRNTILICWLWSNFNLIFFLLTLNMYLSAGHRMKSTKQLKCTLNNRLVSLKHVNVTWVSQYNLNNQ